MKIFGKGVDNLSIKENSDIANKLNKHFIILIV